MLIGSNHLWIASTTLVRGIPLISNNERHFQRVPELRFISYS